MANPLLTYLARDGHLTLIPRLLARGHRRSDIRSAIERGDMLHVCRNWVATTDASQLAVVAVAHGGQLTGPSALSSLGVWDAVDRRVHVRVRPNSHGGVVRLKTPVGAFTPPRFAPTGFRRHWLLPLCEEPGTPPWRTSTVDALCTVASTCPPEQFVACADNAIRVRALSRAALPLLGSLIGPGKAELIRALDPSAESGLESIARFLLGPLAMSIRTQVEIPGIGIGGGVGRVDLLVDGWLVIELDGDAFHDPRADRERNAALVRLGYRIHRFGYEQVINNWPLVEATVRELLAVPPVNRARARTHSGGR